MSRRLAWMMTAWMLALCVWALHLAVAPLLPPRIHVRWPADLSATERSRVEQELKLASPEPVDGTTWSYAPRDRSRQGLARIVRHPRVSDTHHIDRAAFSLSLEEGNRPDWVRSLARVSPIQQFAPAFPAASAGLALIGLAGLWPVGMRTATAAGRTIRQRVREHADLRGMLYVMAIITAASLVVRLVLVSGGGQFYWSDEDRYTSARDMVIELSNGRLAGAAALLKTGQHPLFTLAGLPPAAVERLVGNDLRIPATFFAIWSGFNVALIGLIALRGGASSREALLATALAASSASLFYYARHLLPCDVGMTPGLLAVCAAMGADWRPRDAMLCGACAGIAFLTYGGYWVLGGAALVIQVARGTNIGDAARRALLGGAGLIAVIVAFIGLMALAGVNVVQGFMDFSGSIDQGDFGEGWRLPWAYLWSAEHLMLPLWLAGAAWSLTAWIRSWPLSRAAKAGLIGIAFVYVALVFVSVGLHRFVVYGRLARVLVPFLCLATAAAGERLRVRSPRPWRGLIALAMLQAAANFQAPLRLVFPAEFLRAHPVAVPAGAELRAVNVRHLYPGPDRRPLPPRATLIAQAPHPLAYVPYQYEGFTPAQRRVLRTADITMRLLLVPVAEPAR